jgi:hypothetical protein
MFCSVFSTRETAKFHRVLVQSLQQGLAVVLWYVYSAVLAVAA